MITLAAILAVIVLLPMAVIVVLQVLEAIAKPLGGLLLVAALPCSFWVAGYLIERFSQ